MFQTFESTASPEQGPVHLAALRKAMADAGVDAYLVPRADAHQGEYVADHDARLAWLTGFTGSAGMCIAGKERAALFVDGRYTVQAREQTTGFELKGLSRAAMLDWLRDALPEGGKLAFDPWLHTEAEIGALMTGLSHGPEIKLLPVEGNLIDAVWNDQPAPPQGVIMPQPLEFAGEDLTSKCERLAGRLRHEGQAAVVITLPDSIAWLLNIRGSDIPRNPVPHAFAILHADAQVTLFASYSKVDDRLVEHLGPTVTVEEPSAFGPTLQQLAKAANAPIRYDAATCPLWVLSQLQGAALMAGTDPCVLPKACKNEVEIGGSRQAHLRDAVAMCRFLAWFDNAHQTTLTEVDMVTRLEIFRRETNALMEISFDTIAGAGPNGALPHYHVTTESNRKLEDGQLVVVDSGGQYIDGTTDITRTLLVGNDTGHDEKAAYTRVLKGMIAISRARWPAGLAGMHLDALARYPLWLAGQDFDHGTGHGVGSYLSVHEGPQRLSRVSDVPLQPGMILSNEPGYYREGAFGIRTENLLVVRDAPALDGADPQRDMLDFETLTWVPIERRLILPDMLSAEERDWLNRYHALCREKLSHLLDEETRLWLDQVTLPV